MKQALIDYFTFLKRPRLLKLNNNKQMLWRDCYSLLIFCFVFYAIILGIYYVLWSLKMLKSYESIDLFKEFGIGLTFFLGVVIAPILEELLFRWHLRVRYASIYFVLFAVAANVIAHIDDLRSELFIFLASLVLAVGLHWFLKSRSRSLTYSLWHKAFGFIFYFTAVLFGYVHIGNMKGLTVADPFFILYIATQTMGGMALGYLRIKYGLRYSMLFHACYNVFALGLTLLFR